MDLSRRKFLKFIGVTAAIAAVAPEALVVEPKAGTPPGPVSKALSMIFRRDLAVTTTGPVSPGFKDAYAKQVAESTKKLAASIEKKVFETANREDLLDLITNIDPWDTPWLSAAPDPSKATMHEWTKDTLPDTLNCPGCGAPWENDGCGHCGRTFRVSPFEAEGGKSTGNPVAATVDVYDSDFGTIRIVTNRFLPPDAPETETEFNDMLQRLWEEGKTPQEIAVSPELKHNMMKRAGRVWR